MAHIHELYDFVNAAFIVHPADPKVLLIKHKKLGGWFAPGGHIELNEDPDDALFREVREETGLEFGDDWIVDMSDEDFNRHLTWEVLDPARNHNVKMLIRPWAFEVHNFVPAENHKHIALVYLGKALNTNIELEADAHDAIRWFSVEDLNDPDFKLLDTIRLYGTEAIRHYYPSEDRSNDQGNADSHKGR